MKKKSVIYFLVITALPCSAVSANNVGENVAWQFQTAAELSTRAYLEEIRQRGLNGFYSAPIYNTYIDRQYNCAVNSTATGNLSSSNAVANSPSTAGHSADAIGNENATTDRSGNLASGGSNSSEQENEGRITATTDGGISTSVRGDNFQALNTDQTNSGDQASTVNGSSACQFAPAG